MIHKARALLIISPVNMMGANRRTTTERGAGPASRASISIKKSVFMTYYPLTSAARRFSPLCT